MSIENLDITEQDVKDFCRLCMPENSPKFLALQREFLDDPENSHVGRYCRETEEIMRRMSGDSHLDFERLMVDTCGTKNEDGSVEFDLATFLAGDDTNENAND